MHDLATGSKLQSVHYEMDDGPDGPKLNTNFVLTNDSENVFSFKRKSAKKRTFRTPR